jgi:AcrR family transcriptional regulator
LDGASLTAIARKAGISKANVYRYFESREAVFLELLLQEQAMWAEATCEALAPLRGSGDVVAIADALTRVLLDHPRLCGLLSALASVFEHNVSVDAVVAFKLAAMAELVKVVQALHQAIPALSVEQLRSFMTYEYMLVTGLWPHAHPSPVVAEVCARPGFEQLAVDFESTIRGHAEVTLRGLLTRGPTE